jgi:hypothetical protein
MKIARQRGKDRVIRQALEDLAYIRDPERTLEPGADVVKALRKSQKQLPSAGLCRCLAGFA